VSVGFVAVFLVDLIVFMQIDDWHFTTVFVFVFTNKEISSSLWRRGVVVSEIRRLNEVSAHWARLVLG